MPFAKVSGEMAALVRWKVKEQLKDYDMEAETTVKNKASHLATDYRVLLQVSREALADADMLGMYLAKRGDRFDENGYDHITIFQARMLGLLDF